MPHFNQGIISFISFISFVQIIIASIVFMLFAWGVKSHFKSKIIPLEMLLTSIISFIFFIVYFISSFSQPHLNIIAWIEFIILCLFAAFIFLSAVKATSTNRLSLAFDTDLPTHLNKIGPYKYVRHPFYTSYLIFWFAISLSFESLYGFIIFVTMFAIYFIAAKREENKFKNSIIANQYSDYIAQTGMFIPKVFPK